MILLTLPQTINLHKVSAVVFIINWPKNARYNSTESLKTNHYITEMAKTNEFPDPNPSGLTPVTNPSKKKKRVGGRALLNNFTFLDCFVKTRHSGSLLLSLRFTPTIHFSLSKSCSVNTLDCPQLNLVHLNGLHLLSPWHPGCRTGNIST